MIAGRDYALAGHPTGGTLMQRKRTITCAVGLMALLLSSWPCASAENGARLGTNLTEVNDYSNQLPFIDAFKQSRDWYTQRDGTFDTNEAGRLQLDANGWLRTLSPSSGAAVQYTRVCTLVFSMGSVVGGPQDGKLPYPAGDWTVRFDGRGSLSYSLAGRLKLGASTVPGTDVISVTPQEPGIQICITDIDGSDPIRNIRLYAPAMESRANAGEVFSPDFLARLQGFSTARFMDWQRTNNSLQSDFSKRALPADARYTTERGVPVEVMVDLVNRLGVQPWFNMPQPATDAYVSAFAALVRERLASTLPVYVEYSNEIWNDQFSQGRAINDEGVTQFAGRIGSDFDKRLNRFGERTAQICQLWRTAFGAQADRVRCVMAGQAANSYVAETALTCPLSTLAPCRNQGIYGLAIAPYVGDHIGLPEFEATVAGWAAEADGGLGRLFTEMNTGTELKYEGLSGMPIVRSRISAHAKLAVQQNVSLLAYEGGQHLVGVGAPANNVAINTMMDAANRDPRMGTLYATYLQEWNTAGGGLFVHFSDVGSASRFGRWGALELVTQTTSPKYDALQGFAQTACAPGWNLLGNPYNVAIDVATNFVDANAVTSVWKWLPATNQWAFYTPSLTGQALADYRSSMGYAALTTINGGEGYWIHCKQVFAKAVVTGTAITSSAFKDGTSGALQKGWHLLSIGNSRTPGEFNQDIASATSASGSANLTTLWAWDNARSQWYFYAPGLAAQGGNALGDFIASQGYLDFSATSKNLGASVGFWVNKP
jgi:hypothetical protein